MRTQATRRLRRTGRFRCRARPRRTVLTKFTRGNVFGFPESVRDSLQSAGESQANRWRKRAFRLCRTDLEFDRHAIAIISSPQATTQPRRALAEDVIKKQYSYFLIQCKVHPSPRKEAADIQRARLFCALSPTNYCRGVAKAKAYASLCGSGVTSGVLSGFQEFILAQRALACGALDSAARGAKRGEDCG